MVISLELGSAVDIAVMFATGELLTLNDEV